MFDLVKNGSRSRTRIRHLLRNLGITDLDAFAMTHPDANYIAGLVEALDLFQHNPNLRKINMCHFCFL